MVASRLQQVASWAQPSRGAAHLGDMAIKHRLRKDLPEQLRLRRGARQRGHVHLAHWGSGSPHRATQAHPERDLGAAAPPGSSSGGQPSWHRQCRLKAPPGRLQPC